MISGISQYTGATIAVRLFEDLRPATVAWLRVLFGAMMVLAVSARSQRRWRRADVAAAAVFGVATALMNLCFYLAIDRVALGKSVVIEFIGPVAVAAALTRSRRNAVALALAVVGVLVLSGVELGDEPLGLAFILCASALWAGYIVFARRVAALDRGLSGLGVGLLIGSLVLTPFGVADSGSAFTSRLVVPCVLVALLSTAVGYGIDQIVLRRIPVRRFAVLLALLPVTALVIGWIALDQRPTAVDVLGAAFVIAAVIVQERDVLPAASAGFPVQVGAEPPA